MNFVLAKSVLFEFFRVKSPRCLLVVVAASLVLSFSGPASADESGYRAGQRFIEHPPVSIETGLTDGQTTLSPGSYRVRVRAGRLVFADAEMRQVVLRAPCKFAVLTSNLRAPKITQKKLGTTWRIEYAYRAWRCAVTLRESPAKPDTPQLARTLPELTKIKRPVSSGVYDEPDAYELATRLLEQRALELKPCLLRAERKGTRLRAEDLTKCMCSLSSVWKLPHVEKPLAVALRVVPFPFGLSFVQNPDGRRSECRAWIGRGPVESGVEVGGLWLEVLDEGYEP